MDCHASGRGDFSESGSAKLVSTNRYLLLVLRFSIAIVLAWAFELTPEGIKPTRDIQNTESISHLTGRKLDFGIIALLSMALLHVVLDNYILVDEPETVSELSISAAVEKPITNSSDAFALYIQSQAVVSDSSPFNPYVDHLEFHRWLDEGDHLFAVRLCSGEKYEGFGPCAPKPSANFPELPTLQLVRKHCAQCLSC